MIHTEKMGSIEQSDIVFTDGLESEYYSESHRQILRIRH